VRPEPGGGDDPVPEDCSEDAGMMSFVNVVNGPTGSSGTDGT